jgi:hypothetical protein
MYANIKGIQSKGFIPLFSYKRHTAADKNYTLIHLSSTQSRMKSKNASLSRPSSRASSIFMGLRVDFKDSVNELICKSVHLLCPDAPNSFDVLLNLGFRLLLVPFMTFFSL